VAAAGASSPVPPGIPRDPAPGQYYASPALAALLRSTPAQLAQTPNTVQVTSIADAMPGGFAGQCLGPACPPVLIFIATATRLSAARREERFAAMRLTGAAREQVSLLAAVESTLAGTAGWCSASGSSSCCASRSQAFRSSASRSSPAN
jgi:hypothetical protein